MKHTDVKTLFVQECIKSRNLVAHKISREDKPADALASSSSVTHLMRHVNTAGLTVAWFPVA